MVSSLVSLVLAIGCYSVSQLQQHGKLKLMTNDNGFWGHDSYVRKYKMNQGKGFTLGDNWYYRFFKVKYKERFPLSSTALVFLTDGYHLMQFLLFLFLSLSITLVIGFSWWRLLGVWLLIHLTHFLIYKLLSK